MLKQLNFRLVKTYSLFFILSCLTGSGCQKNTSDSLPNIILIMADDLGYGDLSVYNHSGDIQTPNIDRLAAEGIVFTDYHCTTAQCSPTRYGLLTGRYPWRTRLQTGVLKHFDLPLIEKERKTLATILHEKGYATACFGKWHLGLGWQAKEGETVDPDSWDAEQIYKIDFSKELTDSPIDHGFDYFFGIGSSNNMLPYCYIENRRALHMTSRKKFPVYDTEDEVDLVSEDYKSEQIDQVLWKKLKSWLEKHRSGSADKPFFVYWPTSAIHRPCLPVSPFIGKSRAGLHGDKVTELDDLIGQLVHWLKENGCEENTLIIFTSDNGAVPGDFKPALKKYAANSWGDRYRPKKLLEREAEGERFGFLTYGHGTNKNFNGYKSMIYEGGHRVPCVVRWPGKVKKSVVSDEIVCSTDIMATVADIINYELPAEAGEDSYSILPVLLGQKLNAPLREATILNSWDGTKAVRKGRWKLILARDNGGWYKKQVKPATTPGQLYDLENDPAEQRNIYADHPEMVEELTGYLEKYMREGHSAPRFY